MSEPEKRVSIQSDFRYDFVHQMRSDAIDDAVQGAKEATGGDATITVIDERTAGYWPVVRIEGPEAAVHHVIEKWSTPNFSSEPTSGGTS